MTKITKDDYKTLLSIKNTFSQTLIDKHFDGDQDAAIDAYMQHLSTKDYFKFGGIILKNVFSFSAASETKYLVEVCDFAVTPLTKTFGESALIEALPKESCTQHVVDICNELGGKKLASLVQKAM